MLVPNSLDAFAIPKKYDELPMPDREQPRSIRFPGRLWDAIDRDAVRCGRSSTKQLEVLLSVYYGLRDVELDYDRLSFMRTPPASQTGVPAGRIVLKEGTRRTSKGKGKKSG